MLAFGPVPSRRLGKSLGINNIPAKYCSYDCIYCQLTKTNYKRCQRQEFYTPEDIFCDVQELLVKTKKAGHTIDYFTFVANGEPTLDINLGKEIDLLKFLDYDIAVITNGSLMYREDVRTDLSKADYVSIKVDALSTDKFYNINRPFHLINLSKVKDGLIEFAKIYNSEFVSETMLVDGINTSVGELKKIANFLRYLKLDKSYISIPTRPPLVKWVKCPDEKKLKEAFKIFNDILGNTEFLTAKDIPKFVHNSDIEDELLNIIAVHPMHKSAVKTFLNNANKDWTFIKNMISQKKIRKINYQSETFITLFQKRKISNNVKRNYNKL